MSKSVLSSFFNSTTSSLFGDIAAGGGFSMLGLFSNGEQGAWYSPSDLTTLFQDSAGNTPVTTDGDPVGLMLDKSGNGNDASQTVAAARPTYKTNGTLHWIEFDGVDDALVLYTALTDTKLSSIVGINTTDNKFIFRTNSSSGASFIGVAESGSASSIMYSNLTVSPNLRVNALTESPATRGDMHTLVTGAAKVVTFKDFECSASFNVSPNNIFNYSGFVYAGNFYGMIDRYATFSVDELAATESYIASKSGVTL